MKKRLEPGSPGWPLWQGPKHEMPGMNQGKGIGWEGRKGVGWRESSRLSRQALCMAYRLQRGTGKEYRQHVRTAAGIFQMLHLKKKLLV